MNSDLFSTFDYGFGVGFMSSSVFLWVSSIGFLFLVLNTLNFWHPRSCYSGVVSSFSKGLGLNMKPYQASWFGGGVLFILSLAFLFLFLNMVGMAPYVYGVTAHFAFAMSFSFSVWFMMFLYNCFTNPKLFSASFSFPDLPVGASMTMVWIEVLSNVIRALTLSLRLCLNLASGQIIMGLLGSFANVMFVCGPSVPALMCSLGCTVLLIMDLFIAGLQACLFTALIMLYMDDLTSC